MIFQLDSAIRAVIKQFLILALAIFRAGYGEQLHNKRGDKRDLDIIMDSVVQPNHHIALQLSSGTYKLIKACPNTTISIGKYGKFYLNQVIGRPFHTTYELLEEPDEDGYSLRVVPAAELHAEALITEGSEEVDALLGKTDTGNIEQSAMRTNREINDDGSAQTLTLDEIEELKRNSTGAGKEIIAKLLESHLSIDKKTAFSLAKYKLRKEKKYLKRFTVVPLDVNILTEFMLEQKEVSKIMELRHELIGLLGCWGNVHHSGNLELDNVKPNGRYIVLDDTGGLVVAAMAERMGILYPDPSEDDDEIDENAGRNGEEENSTDTIIPDTNEDHTDTNESNRKDGAPKARPHIKRSTMTAKENTITVIHPYSQPNLALLKYFGFDLDEPDEAHPLFDRLKLASWLQVLEPEADNLYSEKPEIVDEEKLKTYKPRQRGAYYRKQARWARIRSVVDEIRQGGYDGLVVASLMEPDSILKHAVPLLTGGSSVVVYSPTMELLAKLMDQYSTAGRTAYINRKVELERQQRDAGTGATDVDTPSVESRLSSEFTLDPTLLLAPMLQTSRVREWQVLPGRTHPMMSGRGGAEGYIFHGIRATTTGYIQARGVINRKKRKLDVGDNNSTPDES